MSDVPDDKRVILLATRNLCGCIVMAMTLEDPEPQPGHGGTTFPPYKADPLDIADFYKSVHKAQSRKRNPIALTVSQRTGGGGTAWQWRCDKCDPPKTKKGADLLTATTPET